MEPEPPKPPEPLPEQTAEEATQPPGALPAAEPMPAHTTEEPAPEAEPTAQEAPARKRPRGRTTLIIASAALLGIVAGVATGYTVQADRKPTPLPPLSGPPLAYPEKRLSEEEYEPVPAEHDRRVRTDGDLRKLLVEMPEDGRESTRYTGDPKMVPLGTYARQYVGPQAIFRYLLSEDIRRVAEVRWKSGENRLTIVTLVQFRGTSPRRGSVEHSKGQQESVPAEEVTSHRMEGSGNGRIYIYDSPTQKLGVVRLYRARAIAYRGDIMMDIHISGAEPVGEKTIRELAEAQWERL